MKWWILALVVFIFALSLRLWNLNTAGRWWDEGWYAFKGYPLTQLILKKDFSNPYWYLDAADHPPFTSYLYGLASYGDLIKFDPTVKNPFLATTLPPGSPIFRYDLVAMRLVSVVISSLAVVLVFFIGARYFSLFVGICAAMILAMLPHFLGFSQVVDLESFIVLFFTACAFAYYRYLETGERKYLILTGILTGVNLAVKQSNILIFFLYFFTYYVWKYVTKKKTIHFKHLFIITAISFVTLFLLWPMPWFNLPQNINYSYDLWFRNEGLIPEMLFGIRMGARWFFYIAAFLVTTPVIILLLSFVGIKVSFDKKKKWIYLALLIWFAVPFMMMFFHHRQHMVRYIIQVYAPVALLAAIGFEKTITHFIKQQRIKYLSLLPLFAYLMIILLNITPYYVDYFNELVGGTKTVYEKKLFFIGWFGEGLRNPGIYMEKHAQKGDKIGMAINPQQTLYRSPYLHYETFNPQKRYDFVVVNYFNVIRIGFNEDILKKDYKLVYTEKAGGADIAHVYQHK